MSDEDSQIDWSTWFSTYGMLTVERLLGRFKIFLPQDFLAQAVKDPSGVYYQLLRVPLKNVFNGIIHQQAEDYQVYAQKLFIDYLLSGEDAKEQDAPGASIRQDLEALRVTLVEVSDAFVKIEYSHQLLIAESQACLIALTRDLGSTINMMVKQSDIQNKIALYLERTTVINSEFRSYRSQFYTLILKATELLKLLPDYRPDVQKQMENLGVLNFDSKIGEGS